MLIAGLLLSSPAIAATWFEFSSGDGASYYIDGDTLVPGPVTKVWIKSIYAKPRTKAVSAMVRMEINCAAWTMRVTSGVSYDAVGGILAQQTNPMAAFEEIPPETMGYYAAKTVCAIK